MKFVVKSWYHKSRLWKKFKKISKKLSHTLVTGWGIPKKFQRHLNESVKFLSPTDHQIELWLQNFLCRQWSWWICLW